MWTDVLHSFYRRQVIIRVGGKLYRTWVRWYRAPDGTRQLPGARAILADPWEAEHETWGLQVGRWVGPRVWDNGRNRDGYKGQCYVGDPDWFKRLDLPGWVLAGGHPPPIPPLPQPLLGVALGGLVFGGSGVATSGAHRVATGGLVLLGSGVPPGGVGSGGLVLGGSGVGAYGSVSLSGQVTMYAGASIPSGWLECDGSAVSRSTYAALFAAIGTVWGAGDGSTTFNLPDFRGRTLIGAGAGSGLTPRALGDTGGEEAHQLVTTELAAHAHGVTDPGHNHPTGGGSQDVALYIGTLAQAGSDFPGQVSDSGHNETGSVTTGVTVDSAGSDAPHNNMQPWACCHWIIQT